MKFNHTIFSKIPPAFMEHCNYCKKSLGTAPLLCSACHLATYCGEECAERDWFIGPRLDTREKERMPHLEEHGRAKEDKMDRILGSGKKGEFTVYLGSVDALIDPAELSHIDSVVSALGENYDNVSIRRLVGSERYHMRVTLWDNDTEDISRYFEPVAAWIREQMVWNRHVLIHCVAGHSRSTTLLLYYMMRYEDFKSVDDALAYVQERRPTARPNPGFMRQLKRATKGFGE